MPAAIQSLKHLMQGETGVALIVAGVPTLRDAILSEPSGETYRRFTEFRLPRVEPGSAAARVFDGNLKASARMLGMEIAEEDALAERILLAENGQVGRSVALAKNILRHAVTRKRDALVLEDAARVYRRAKPGSRLTPFEEGSWDDLKSELQANGWRQG